FDSLPMQDGLGFGLGPSIRIAKAQKDILRIQRDGVTETIRRTLKLLVDGYNADLESHSNLKRRVDLTEAIQEQLYDRIRLGDDVGLEELVIATRNHIEADTAYFAVQYRFLTTEDRLARLIFHGDYAAEGERP